MMMVMVLQSIAILSDSSDTAFVSSLSAGSFVIFAHCEHHDDDYNDHVHDHDHHDYHHDDHHHYNQ